MTKVTVVRVADEVSRGQATQSKDPIVAGRDAPALRQQAS
jgi:hypothetical protein